MNIPRVTFQRRILWACIAAFAFPFLSLVAQQIYNPLIQQNPDLRYFVKLENLTVSQSVAGQTPPAPLSVAFVGKGAAETTDKVQGLQMVPVPGSSPTTYNPVKVHVKLDATLVSKNARYSNLYAVLVSTKDGRLTYGGNQNSLSNSGDQTIVKQEAFGATPELDFNVTPELVKFYHVLIFEDERDTAGEHDVNPQPSGPDGILVHDEVSHHALLLPFEFKARDYDAANLGFDPTGSETYISVEPGATNDTAKLVLGMAVPGMELKVAAGDEDKLQLLAPTSAITGTETNISVKGNAAITAPKTATIELRMQGESEPLAKLNVLCLPTVTPPATVCTYKMVDGSSPNSSEYDLVTFPSQGAISTEIRSRFTQARVAVGSDGPMETKDFGWDNGLNGVPEAAKDGVLDYNVQGELGMEMQAFSNHRSEFAGKINVCYVQNLKGHGAVSEYPLGLRVPGLNVVFVALSRWLWSDNFEKNFEKDDADGANKTVPRVAAHEVGHYLGLAYWHDVPSDSGHDAGPFPTKYKTVSLMRSGSQGKHGKWLRWEDWKQANETARNL